MKTFFNMVLEALLLIFAVSVLAIPEVRAAPALRGVFFSLFAIVSVKNLLMFHRHGVFRMTPRQVYTTVDARPRTSLLSGLAVFVGLAAAVMLSLQ